MARARSLAEFQKSFPDEESCAAFLIKRRWPDGFACPGCGKCRVVGLKSRPRLHECLDCGRQSSVTADTAMHRSKLPLTAWFWAAHLMTTHSNGMSARQLEDQLGVTYKTEPRRKRAKYLDHSKRCSGSPSTTSPPAIGTSSSETILAKAPAGPTRPAYYI
jgi:Transposase zinc-ribbon domain